MMLLELSGIDSRAFDDDFWIDLICDVAAHHPPIAEIAGRLEAEARKN